MTSTVHQLTGSEGDIARAAPVAPVMPLARASPLGRGTQRGSRRRSDSGSPGRAGGGSDRETGASAVEYALMVGLLAVAIITSVAALGNRAKSNFQTIANTLPSGANPSWVWCANENGSCTVPGTKSVRYGYAPQNKWAGQTKTGTFGCNNAVFGDPAYGYGKVCQYDANS